MLFGLVPSTSSFAGEARYKIDTGARIPASPRQVYEEFTDCTHGREWVDRFVRLNTLTPDAPADQRIYEESFTFMSVRVRTLEVEHGRRWVASIDRCTLPIARQILQEATFEPAAGGGTDFRWRIYYTPSWIVRPFLKGAQRVFEQLFRRSTEQLAAFFHARQRLMRGEGGIPLQ
ncbi:hypothetical protein BON30_22445 [Cystobacter ferrugineus]|uniref:Ribosome association toxin RatA n=1 Tax=Cystobacter ferrugineus TaxID=83449 RepID=A0A1L9B9Q1_9BACT|nr:hypothetical protein BON30_22445 [Cystobacter ferrugineus]